METEKTPFKSIKFVTSQTAHVNCNNHPPKPTPHKSTPYKPNTFYNLAWGQTQNQGGAPGGDGGQTQNKGGAPGGDGGQTQSQGGAPGGDGGQTQNKGGAPGGTGDKPKKNNVQKVGMGEIPIVPFEQPPQRNVKFEQDRKRSSVDTDGKNSHKNKRGHRDACVSDLVWPICKIDNTEYSKQFNIQILKAMTIFYQGMARLMAWVEIVKYKDIIIIL